MDTQKDNQKVDGIVKFVDTQSAKTNPFGDNRVGERVYRRSEKISSAIFLLTSDMSDNEPLRIKARSMALKLLEDVLSLRSQMRSVNSEHVVALKGSVRELISICRILAVAGFVSFQNAAVLSEALDELTTFLQASQRSTLSESTSFSKEDFLDAREPLVAERKYVVRDMSQENKKDKKYETDVTSEDVQEKSTESKGQTSSPGLSSRSQAILEVLRTAPTPLGLGIRDVAANLPEFSEKMIQRELAVLVQKDLVTKEGLKRWSRYALAASGS